MILRLLNFQGIAGIAVSLAFGVLLLIQKAETRHWKKESAGFEQRYHAEQATLAGTVTNYRAAADTARAADQANAARVAAEQVAINERTTNEFEARLAVARAAAERLRVQPKVSTDPGAGRSASMPRLSTAARGVVEAPGQDRFPQSDALTATEQAIQLDELIKWVRAQAKVDNNPPSGASPPDD